MSGAEDALAQKQKGNMESERSAEEIAADEARKRNMLDHDAMKAKTNEERAIAEANRLAAAEIELDKEKGDQQLRLARDKASQLEHQGMILANEEAKKIKEAASAEAERLRVLAQEKADKELKNAKGAASALESNLADAKRHASEQADQAEREAKAALEAQHGEAANAQKAEVV